MSYFAWLKLFKRESLIGLDVSTDGIRLLALQRTAAGFHIEKIIQQELCAGAIRNEIIIDWHSVRDQLVDIIMQAKLVGRDVALALPNTMIMRKKIELPCDFKQDELANEIKLRLIEYFPGLLPKEVQFDFIIESTKNEMYQILLLIVRKAQIQLYLDAVMQAHLKIIILDIDVYARARAGSWCLLQQAVMQEEAAVLVDLHSSLSTFMVFHHYNLIFHQSWHPPESGAQVLEDIKKYWSLAQTAFPKLNLRLVGFSGSIAGLKNLADDLKEIFSVPVCCISPLQGMTKTTVIKQEEIDQLSLHFLLCCGLAMRVSFK